MQLGFSRRQFAEQFEFSSATLQAWEDGKYPVPHKSILRYVNALLGAGLVTSLEWFTQGTGLPPRPKEILCRDPVTNDTIRCSLPEKEAIHREISFFEKLNHNSIVVAIPDDTMLPFFQAGDYVGGNVLPGEQAKKCIGSFCIVTTSTGETLVRKIKYGSKEGSYHLVSTNLDSNIDSAQVLNCSIEKIAQVVWHRKVLP